MQLVGNRKWRKSLVHTVQDKEKQCALSKFVNGVKFRRIVETISGKISNLEGLKIHWRKTGWVSGKISPRESSWHGTVSPGLGHSRELSEFKKWLDNGFEFWVGGSWTRWSLWSLLTRDSLWIHTELQTEQTTALFFSVLFLNSQGKNTAETSLWDFSERSKPPAAGPRREPKAPLRKYEAARQPPAAIATSRPNVTLHPQVRCGQEGGAAGGAVAELFWPLPAPPGGTSGVWNERSGVPGTAGVRCLRTGSVK